MKKVEDETVNQLESMRLGGFMGVRRVVSGTKSLVFMSSL